MTRKLDEKFLSSMAKDYKRAKERYIHEEKDGTTKILPEAISCQHKG